MDGAAEVEEYDYKHLDVNHDVGEDENGDVDPLSHRQSDEATRPEMIWCKRHRKKYIGTGGGLSRLRLDFAAKKLSR